MVQPSAHEQYMLEMINRARLNPTAEGNSFGVTDLNQGLTAGTISTDSKQPLAFNLLLIDSSRSHSQWMLDTDTFSHTGVDGTSSNQRMRNAGYSFTGSWRSGENIGYKGTTGTVNSTAYTEDIHENLFKSAGHRKNLLKSDFREIGIATTTGEFTSGSNTFNALMITQNFAKSGSSIFLTGVAYDDLILEDDFYTVGEGLGGIDVVATNTSNGTSYTTTTMTAGGYQVALPSGTYDVSFSDSGQIIGDTSEITIGSENIKLDLNTDNLNSGDDNFVGGNNSDSLYGGDGQDTLRGNSGDDTLHGGAGIDTVEEYTYNDFTLTDTQLIGRGTDTLSQIELAKLTGNHTDNTIDASSVTQLNVTLNGGSGHDTLLGGDKDDVLIGYNHQDSLDGGAGHDNLNGGSGHDILNGGNGNDTVIGGTGNDTLNGGSGNDNLKGGSGNGNDAIDGGSGYDTLNGGSGDDTLNGGMGIDTITEYTYSNFTLTDTQLIGRGTDTLSQIEFAKLAGNHTGNLMDASAVTQLNVTLQGGSGDDTLLGGDKDDFLNGYNDDDSLVGGNGDDLLNGGNGNDTLWGSAGNDTLKGGGGSDIFALESSQGIKAIDDFSDGTDLLGLTGTLDFNDLSIANNSAGTAAIIYDLSNSNAVLASISNVDAINITQADFTTI